MKKIFFKFYCILIVVFLLISGGSVSAQLKADFSSDISGGCAPLIVKFKDLSGGNPTKWRWDLGNGTVSFLKNPSATYFSTGSYAIKLIVQNANGSDTIIKQKYIVVAGIPVANFQGTQLTGCYPLPAKFTDQSTASSGNIASWEWDFGDGSLSQLQNPGHTYSASGNFNVSLRVTNSAGCSKTITKNNYVKIASGVKASFNNTVPTVCAPPVTIHFNNTSTGTGNLTYKWQLGDSSITSQVNPVHTYDTKGTYTVSLIVTSSEGCTDTATKINAVDLRTVSADFSLPSTVCVSTPVLLENISTPSPVSSRWYFSDSTVFIGTNATKTFDSAGTYLVKLVSQFLSCSDSITKSINVVSKPVSTFTADDSVSCKSPFTINFKETSQNAVRFLWKFGDGDSSIAANPFHTYLKNGNYSVTLESWNQEGCSDSLIKYNFVRISPPVIKMPDLPALGCIPFNLNFHSSVSSVDSIASYRWDFGDSTSSTLANPTHNYLKPGVYDIMLSVITDKGCTDTLHIPKSVSAGYKLQTNFTASPRQVCAYIPILFSDSTKGMGPDSSGNPNKWLWLFGDKQTSGDRYAQHLYGDTGTYSITLIAYNNGCADTATFKNYIHISAPVAKFDYSFSCNDHFTRQFKNTSEGADTWIWNFGDGVISTDENPVHTYQNAGTYSVSLKVTNKYSGCEHTTKQTIQIINEKAQFSVDQTVICKSLSVNFQTTNVNFINVKQVSWIFGDGAIVNATQSSISHTYAKAGVYNVTLVVTDKLGCSDTLLRPTLITVNSPVANFSNVPFSCVNSNVVFADSSLNDGHHAITSWEWNFGEPGSTPEIFSSAPYTHTYSTGGTYTLSLKVTDVNGCFDVLTKTDALIISKPVASFDADKLSCTGSDVQFSNLSSGSITNYAWSFGDLNTSENKAPSHAYNATGTYTVSLKVTDKYGCTDNISKPNFITIADPRALFSMSDSFSNCPPLVVTFTSLSKNAISYNWTFGDGNTSTLQNPTHFYSTAGIFTVVLRVTAAGGCIDSLKKTIVIQGPSGTFSYSNLKGCLPTVSNFTANVKNTSSVLWDFNDGTTKQTNTFNTSHTFDVSGAFIPKIVLLDTAGCKVPITGLDTINVFDVKSFFNWNSITYCDSLSVGFTDSSITNDQLSSYLWSIEDSNFSTDENTIHTFKKSGNYKVRFQLTTQAGCSSTLEKTIPVNLVVTPKIQLLSVNEMCAQSLFKLTAAVDNPDSLPIKWNWNFGNGASSSDQNPDPVKYASSGNYTILLSADKGNGCTDTASKIITIHPRPVLQLNYNATVCNKQPQQLSASGADTYSWWPAKDLSCANCATPVYTPDSSIQYHVTGTTAFGCITYDSASIKVLQPFAMQVSSNDSMCSNKSVRLLATGGATHYLWSPAEGLDNTSIASPVAKPSVTTRYRVIGANNETCFADTGYVVVTVFPIPKINAGGDKTINAGASIELVPQLSDDVINSHWTPTLGIVSSNYPSVIVKPTQTTEYTLDAVNAGGCRSSDKVTVFVLCNNANVFIPNTFSPNGDGSNDVFYPRGDGLFSIKSFRVFNRWGELIFQRNDLRPNDASLGWDGRYKGVPLTSDVFIYVMEVVCENNTVLTFKGNIALIK